MGLASLFGTPISSPLFSLGSKRVCYFFFPLGPDPDGRKGTREGEKGNRKENENRRLLARIFVKETEI